MTLSSPLACPQERDVLDLVAIGQWPERADPALRTHVAGCVACGEVAAVASAVREWADEAPRPKLPDASVVWYRAQVRAREEANRQASRPVLVAQILAVAAVVVGVAWFGPGVDWMLSLAPDVSMPAVIGEAGEWRADWTGLARWSWLGWAALAAIATWAFAGTVAWVVTAKD